MLPTVEQSGAAALATETNISQWTRAIAKPYGRAAAQYRSKFGDERSMLFGTMPKNAYSRFAF